MACSKAVLSSMKEVYSCTGLFQETRKLSNKEYNLPSKKKLEKEENIKPKVNRRMVTIKMRRNK